MKIYNYHVIHLFYLFTPIFGWIPNKIFNLRFKSRLSTQMCIDRIVNPDFNRLAQSNNKVDSDTSWQTPSTTIFPIDSKPIAVKPALITFDAIDTLIEPSQSVGRWYREALNMACDMRIRLPRPALFTAAYDLAYSEMSKKHPCFGAKSGMSSKDWWFGVVKNTYKYTQNLNNVLSNEEFDKILPEVFDILHNKIFNSKEGWVLKEDAEYTITKLKEWQEFGGGPKLGIIANFDERLQNILNEMGILHYFDFVLTSYESKLEKPDKLIFELALERAKCTDPKLAFHIGTSIDLDVSGSTLAGWTPLRFNEWFDEQFPDWNSIETIETAKEGSSKQLEFYKWGRRDSSTGLEWIELWGIDELLSIFGHPEDETKPIKTTYIRNFRGDF